MADIQTRTRVRDQDLDRKITEVATQIGSMQPGSFAGRAPTLDDILHEGLKSLGHELADPALVLRVKRLIVTQVMQMLSSEKRQLQEEVERLKKLDATQENTVKYLRAKIALMTAEPKFNQAEMSYIRTCHAYGLAIPDLAELFKTDDDEIIRVLNGGSKDGRKGQAPVRFGHRAAPGPASRSLDL